MEKFIIVQCTSIDNIISADAECVVYYTLKFNDAAGTEDWEIAIKQIPMKWQTFSFTYAYYWLVYGKFGAAICELLSHAKTEYIFT